MAQAAQPAAPAHPLHGEELNLISALASLRGEVLLACDNRLRAAQWFLAALRLDPHNVSAMQVREPNEMQRTEEEREREREMGPSSHLSSSLSPSLPPSLAPTNFLPLFSPHLSPPNLAESGE
jgi:hypothetical protein